MNPIQHVQLLWQTDPQFVFGVWSSAALALYYAVVWVMVGRDPSPGTIVVCYEPPEGLSPAAMRYLRLMGLDERGFGAALLDLAARGCMRIEKTENEYSLWRGTAEFSALSADEKGIAKILFEGRNQVKLNSDNQRRIYVAIRVLKRALDRQVEKAYLLANRRYLLPGVGVSVVLTIFLVLAEGVESPYRTLFLSLWLLGWTLGLVFLLLYVSRTWKSTLFRRRPEREPVQHAISASAFVVPFVAGEFGVIYAYLQSAPGWLLAFVFLHAAMALAAHSLLKAPNRAGRKLLDRIEGFRRFLAAAEKDRLNFLNPPEQTPALFEKNLPYAFALDVEQQWSQQFVELGVQSSESALAVSATAASSELITLDLSTFGVFMQRWFPFDTSKVKFSVGPK